MTEYYELNCKIAGSVPANKNHQGGLHDPEDESDGKIFSIPDSKCCPVKTIKNLYKTPESQTLMLFPDTKGSRVPKL